MTDIALRESTELAHTDPTGGRLVAWAEAASAAHQLANALSLTTFVPAHFRGKVDDATAAILMGDELGLLVWQDFPFACSYVPDDEPEQAVLRAEAEVNIKRLRNHASLALWCGNNEIEQLRANTRMAAKRLRGRGAFGVAMVGGA